MGEDLSIDVGRVNTKRKRQAEGNDVEWTWLPLGRVWVRVLKHLRHGEDTMRDL